MCMCLSKETSSKCHAPAEPITECDKRASVIKLPYFFFTFEDKGELREEREGEDLAFVCDSLPACSLLYLSSHFDPSHFSCHAIKRTGRNQRWLVTFREAAAGVTWWRVASERAMIISENSRKTHDISCSKKYVQGYVENTEPHLFYKDLVNRTPCTPCLHCSGHKLRLYIVSLKVSPRS